ATNVVEHPELVAERVVRLAKIVGRENVIAGTDCGFRARSVSPARPSLDHVGKARSARGGRPAREQGIVELTALTRMHHGPLVPAKAGTQGHKKARVAPGFPLTRE